MHNYVLRINDDMFNRIRVESFLRGISINKMINHLLEIGLITILKEELDDEEKD